jgi:hypothetical protein
MECKRRQLDQLDTAGGQPRAGADEEGVGWLVRHTCESRIDLLAARGLEQQNLQPHGASGRLRVMHDGFAVRFGGRSPRLTSLTLPNPAARQNLCSNLSLGAFSP